MINYVITRMAPDSLEHHGIKGQKWGIRRYQNPDGTLTALGRARIAETSNGYLNPSSEDKQSGRAKNREKVGAKYCKEYWGLVDKGMDQNSPSDEGHKIWDKHKDAYASATLKDLKMKNTAKAREDVKRLLSEIDPNYEYDAVDRHGDDWDKYSQKKYDRKKEVEKGEENYRSEAKSARDAIGNASRTNGVGMGTGEAESLRSYIGIGGKKYRDLERFVSKASKQAGNEYDKTFDRKGDKKNRANAAREYADAIASASMKYINENFDQKDRDKAMAYVYVRFVQEQDRDIRSQFGKINR